VTLTSGRELSVAIPVYNGGKTIRDTLLEILKQTHREFEILVYDDGSKDHTPELVTRVAQQDSRVKLHRCDENRGRGFARNALLKLAAGRLVAWQDADDNWAPTKLEEQLAALVPLLDAGERAVLLSTYQINRLDDGGPLALKTPPAEFDVAHVFSPAYAEYHFQLQAVLGPADLFAEAGGFDEALDWSEDLDVALKLLRSGVRLVGHRTDHPLATYNHTLRRARPKIAEESQLTVRSRFRDFAATNGYDIDKVLTLRGFGYLGKMYLNRGRGQKAIELALRAMTYVDPRNPDDVARLPAVAAMITQATRAIALAATSEEATKPAVSPGNPPVVAPGEPPVTPASDPARDG
jgi:glycosyltransferase involved in cell wall biosynthesis